MRTATKTKAPGRLPPDLEFAGIVMQGRCDQCDSVCLVAYCWKPDNHKTLFLLCSACYQAAGIPPPQNLPVPRYRR